MKRIWGLKPGAPFNPEYPETFLKGVRNMFDNIGETKSEVKLNPDTHTADVTLKFGAAPPGKRP